MPADRKLTILNVDDDESGRYVVTRLLGREGFSVWEAGTGEEALRLATQGPDLVLLDVNLPDLSGLEVCRRIKQDPGTASIPVLHLSATSISQKQRATGLESGADGYLTHPVDPGLLVATIRALLRAKHAESCLQAAAQQWLTTFNAISHGVCLLDREGRIEKVNRAFAALLAKEEGELIGRLHSEAFACPQPPEGWPFDRIRTAQQRESSEIELDDRWFTITADPVFDEGGSFSGAVCTLIDISEHRKEDQEREQLVRQIEAERARLEAVLSQMPAGVIIAEAPSGRLVLRNERVSKMLGMSVEAAGIEAYAIYKGFHSSGRPYAPEEWPLARSILKGEVINGEDIEFVRPDGSRTTLRVSSGPVRDSGGYIVAAVATLQDITERKELEDQFRQSQKMEAVGRLAGGVAHDFNNLLTIIGGYSQMVFDSLPPKDRIRQDVEAIIDASNRATALTRQLLTFSRRQLAQPKVLDVNRLLARMNRVLRRVIGEDLELKLDLGQGLGRIKIDPAQLEQVIMNLVVNARDAMPKGGQLSIQTSGVEMSAGSHRKLKLADGHYLQISVSDTGCGMSPETKSHLFEPFFTTKPKGKGTGLGLSTVYGIVKQCGGEIEVDTEPGKGSTFRIYLPLSEAPAMVSSHVRSTGLNLKGTETILLVEDEAEVRRFARELLTRQGYAILEAASGPDALRLWKRHRGAVDLLLTDVIMPQMSGRELADELKALRPDLKVLFMSGYTDDVIAQHGILDLATEFLQKPFTHETLGRKVREVLDPPRNRTA
jgi:PAS domain S-box-containing protein